MAVLVAGILTASGCFAQGGFLYAGSTAAGVLRSLDGGFTWQATAPLAGPVTALAVDANAPGTLYSGGLGVFKSTDAGSSWTALAALPEQAFVLALAIDAARNTIYAGTLTNGLFKSADGGASWQPTALTEDAVSVLLLDPQDPSAVLAGGPLGLFQSSDGGANFAPRQFTAEPGVSVNALAADPRNPAVLYLAASNGMYKSANRGSTWTRLPCGCGQPEPVFTAIAVDRNDSGRIYAAASNPPLRAFLLRSADGGATWAAATAGFRSAQIQGLASAGAGLPLVAGSQGGDGLLRSLDGGATWNPAGEGVPPGLEVLAVVGTNPPLAPIITSVVSAASFLPPIQGNSWVTITGAALSSGTRAWGPADFSGDLLPSSLDGVRVSINGKAASVYFISPGQINVLAAVDDVEGPASVQVTTSTGASAPFTVQMRREAPAFFAYASQGRNYVAATFADGNLLHPAAPQAPVARPGSAVILYGTGCGATDPPLPSGRLFSGAANLVHPAVVTIGGTEAQILFAGMSAPGVCQFNVLVPPGTAAGNRPAVVRVNGRASAADVFLEIGP